MHFDGETVNAESPFRQSILIVEKLVVAVVGVVINNR